MMVPFQLSTLPVTPWKNGGGETREIVCVPSPDAPFLWRASIATLQADGPFSPFPGVDRTIVLLAGQPLRLRGEEIDHPLALWQPWAFPGEWALSSVGIVAPGLDFNVMTQRGRASLSAGARRRRFRSLAICNALPPKASLMCCRGSGIWPGGAAPPAAVSAGAATPRASCGLSVPMGASCWRRLRSNNQLRKGYT